MKTRSIITPSELEEIGEQVIDLSPFIAELNKAEVGGAIEVEVDEGENPRALKLRFGMAAKKLGFTAKYFDIDKGKVFRVKLLHPEEGEENSSPIKKRGRPKLKGERSGKGEDHLPSSQYGGRTLDLR